jgi:hypothetical protein
VFLLSYFLLLGKTLYTKFGNLANALQYAYPDISWDFSKFSVRGKKSGQRWLKLKIEELLLGIEVVEDYQHPELTWGLFLIEISFVVLTLQRIRIDQLR